MRSTIRCAVCSSCLTLLASPDSAWGGLGRARVFSRRGVLFSSFFQYNCSDLKGLLVCFLIPSMNDLRPTSSLPFVTQIRGQIAGTPPHSPLRCVPSSCFSTRVHQQFLPSSTRVELRMHTLRIVFCTRKKPTRWVSKSRNRLNLVVTTRSNCKV